MTPLDESYALCDRITAERARNFHFAFSVLPKERYRSICALYAFTRTADDLSDDEADPQKALENSRKWRAAFDAALNGDCSAHAMLPAVADTFRKYSIPPQYMHDLIDGTEMDARQNRYAAWPDTYLYCYRVASVIGMMTIHVFGFDPGTAGVPPATGDAGVPPASSTNNPHAADKSVRAGRPRSDSHPIALAEKMGIAFQLTNILRDLKEDAGRDRIYLPLEDLRAHNIPEDVLLRGEDIACLRPLVEFEFKRAFTLYEDAQPLIGMILPESRDALGSLVAIYKRLLEEIQRRDYDVFTRRVSLSAAEKLSLAAGLAWKKFLKFGAGS